MVVPAKAETQEARKVILKPWKYILRYKPLMIFVYASSLPKQIIYTFGPLLSSYGNIQRVLNDV